MISWGGGQWGLGSPLVADFTPEITAAVRRSHPDQILCCAPGPQSTLPLQCRSLRPQASIVPSPVGRGPGIAGAGAYILSSKLYFRVGNGPACQTASAHIAFSHPDERQLS